MPLDLESIKERIARYDAYTEVWVAFDLTEDARALVPEVERLRTLLRRCEWAGLECDSNPSCPVCAELEPGPHAPDCDLARALTP